MIAGCSRSAGTTAEPREPGGVLFVYVALPAAQMRQPDAIEAVIDHLDLLRQPFLELRPSVRIQFIPFDEEQPIWQVRCRNLFGLGPDLILGRTPWPLSCGGWS
ncbi:MAG: hypothetical protein EA413_07200 [Cyanobium sp. PLM2.Bin73]|nr:MAG: hypothetical protein EA413_07200 [Cyanobium sp. PLM2.Bin73]